MCYIRWFDAILRPITSMEEFGSQKVKVGEMERLHMPCNQGAWPVELSQEREEEKEIEVVYMIWTTHLYL